MMKEFLSLTMKGIRYRPIRSWLTVIGIVIGIMLVVVILALSNGVTNIINKQLQMFGSDLLVIIPGKEAGIVTGLIGGQKFKFSDVIDLENIPGVKLAAPFDVGTVSAEFEGEKKATLVHSSNWSRMRPIFEESTGVTTYKGAWPTDELSNEIVLGYLAGNSFFKNKVQVGDEIIIQSKRLRVSGILTRSGNQDDDKSLYMSWDLFHNITGIKPGAMSIILVIRPDADINLVARQVRFQLEKQEEVRDFNVLTPEKTTMIVGNILGAVELVLVIIALVSLIVGAVGIMNTMYTSVLERTKQIGIMKAVGASNDAILSLFLIESGIIGLVGGLLGIFSGIFLSYLIGILAENLGAPGLFSFATIDYLELFVILTVTFITGVVSGIMPARQAAKLEPAEALRYE